MSKTIAWLLGWVVCVYGQNVKEPDILQAWRDFPLKTLMNTTVLQPNCQRAYQGFLKGLRNYDLDHLKMLDATAKLPSGILNGNIVQYGDFDQCLKITNAQYCLVEIDVRPILNGSLSQYKELVVSYNFFSEEFSDPAHRVPGFTMARWGFCIPSECSSSDLVNSLKTNYGVEAQVRPGMCQKSTKTVNSYSLGDYVARYFFTFILLAVAISTLIDRNHMTFREKNKDVFSRVLMSFSAKKNLSELLTVKADEPNKLSGLDGIRFLCAFALLCCHKSITLFYNPYINRTSTISRLSQPWTVLAKNAIVYTDAFMLLSGLLNANALLNDLSRTQRTRFKDKLISRLFRILPNVIALILFCTYILPTLGSGPQWPSVVIHHSTLCKNYMWRNLLFIHNYFGFENMCLTHTHQISIDMQLFLITPFLTYLLYNWKRLGLTVLFGLATVSTILRFLMTYKYEVSTVVYFGIPISKMFEVCNVSYILPTHRATIYLIGVYLAYFLKTSNPNPSFSKIQIFGLWSFFLPLFLGAWLYPYHMVQKEYVYEKLESALNAALYPIFWGASVSFGIYAFNRNISGFFGRILNWKYFQVTTKLSYALYLVQFPVFFYNVGLTRHADEYHTHYNMQIYETLLIVLCSFALVILVEMPFQNIKKEVFDYRVQSEKTRDGSVQTRKYKSG